MGGIFKALLLFLALVSLAASEKSYKNYSVIRTQTLNADQVSTLRKLLESSKFDFWREPRVGKVADIMASPHEAALLEHYLTRKQIHHHVLVKDVQDLIEKTRPSSGKADPKKFALTTYHSYGEISEYLVELQNTHSFVEVKSIGKSYEGRDTWAIHIKKAGALKPTVWIEAGIHAREWISPAVSLYIIDQLVSNADGLAERYNFYILPSVNPDGYEYSHSSDRMWRKSRSETGSSVGCKGVDLNRNFDFHYGESGFSTNKCSDTYNGPKAFSEVESRNLRDFISSLDDKPIFAICLHSFSQLWLYPYGYAYDAFPENVEDQRRAGEKAVKAIYQTHGKVYENINSADLYPASGAADDYYAGVVNVPYTVTLELRDTGLYGFVLPEEQILPTAEEAMAGIKAALEDIAETIN